MQGKNDFDQLGFGGPCPPNNDGAHRYFFKLFALDQLLDLKPEASKVEVLAAMENHVQRLGIDGTLCPTDLSQISEYTSYSSE